MTVLFFPIWTMKLEIEFCGNGPSGGVDDGLAAVMHGRSGADSVFVIG